MRDKLPILLSTGVTATIEGLVMHDSPSPMYDIMRAMINPEPMIRQHDAGDCIYTWPWSDVAYRLRYREGEPWCHVFMDVDGDEDIVCRNIAPWASVPKGSILHRLAAILCDDAEAFRVLHWCVTNLGGQDD